MVKNYYRVKDIKYSQEAKTKYSIKRKGDKSETNLDSLIRSAEIIGTHHILSFMDALLLIKMEQAHFTT